MIRIALFGLWICSFPVISFAQCGSQIIITPSSPYQEGFEANDGGWYVSAASISSDWTWGTPAKPTISSAGGGVNSWVTGGLTNSFYNYGEKSYLQSPCFNISALSQPYISFKVFWESESGNDGSNLQYSTDNGVTWKIVGTLSDPPCLNSNWYNGNVRWLLYPQSTTQNSPGWSGSSGAWVTAQHIMPYSSYPDLQTATTVIFRFAFFAGTIVNDFDGFAIDDIYIGEAPPPPATPVVNVVQTTCVTTTGTITVISPVGPGITYSIDGTTFQSSPIFNNVSPNNYTVTVKNSNNCTSTTSVTINPSAPPAAPVVTTPVNYCQGAAAIPLTAIGANLLWYTTLIGGTGNSSAPTPSTITPGSVNYYVSQTISGCESQRSLITVDIVPDYVAPISGNTAICLKDGTALLSDITPGGIWSSSNPLVATINTSGTITALTTGGTIITYTLPGAGCTATTSFPITINDFHLSLTANPNPVIYGNPVTLSTSSPSSNYTITSWQPFSLFINQSATSQSITPVAQFNTYSVTGTADGCSATATVTVEVTPINEDVFVANAFTPNGDGTNEVLYVRGNTIAELDMRIFNQWGQEVFATTNKYSGWDGRVNGKLQPVGVYVYVLKAVLNSGKEVIKKGSVTLIR